MKYEVCLGNYGFTFELNFKSKRELIKLFKGTLVQI